MHLSQTMSTVGWRHHATPGRTFAAGRGVPAFVGPAVMRVLSVWSPACGGVGRAVQPRPPCGLWVLEMFLQSSRTTAASASESNSSIEATSWHRSVTNPAALAVSSGPVGCAHGLRLAATGDDPVEHPDGVVGVDRPCGVCPTLCVGPELSRVACRDSLGKPRPGGRPEGGHLSQTRSPIRRSR